MRHTKKTNLVPTLRVGTPFLDALRRASGVADESVASKSAAERLGSAFPRGAWERVENVNMVVNSTGAVAYFLRRFIAREQVHTRAASAPAVWQFPFPASRRADRTWEFPRRSGLVRICGSRIGTCR